MLDSAASTPIRTHVPSPEPLLAFAFQTESRANGGIASMTLILESLRAFAPVVVTQAETPTSARWRSSGLEVVTVAMPDPPASASPVDRLVAFARRLPARTLGQFVTYRMVRERGAKVVYFNDQAAFTFGALGARLAGARIVLALRDTTGLDRSRWVFASLFSDVVVSLSTELESRLRAAIDARDPDARLGRPEFATIPSIVREPSTTVDRSRARERFGIAEATFAIGVVGALVPRKRQRDLIRALGPALARIGAELHLVGDFDPLAHAYSAECAGERDRLDPEDRERVHFVGYTDDVAPWYRALDLVVVGSDDEGLARCMIEALSYGVPVVSTAVCSATETLAESGAGVVVPVGAFGELAAAVEALAADPATRARKGAIGRALVATRFSAAEVGLAYDRLFGRLARRPSTTDRIAST